MEGTSLYFDFTVLGDAMAKALLLQGVKTPSDIQSQAIPLITSGKDVVAQAPTGTGKTIAYLAPVINAINMEERGVQALILAPSYELAAQVHSQAKLIWENMGLANGYPALIIGGAGVSRQIESLKLKPRIVTASPGRALELIKLKKLRVHTVKTIVFDEGDRLLLGDSKEAIKEIVKAVPKNAAKLLFSATITDKALSAAMEYMREPSIIRLSNRVPEGIVHKAIVCERREKLSALKTVVNTQKNCRGLVFFKSAAEAQRALERSYGQEIRFASLSAKQTGQERKAALSKLRDGAVNALAATDAAARGLDITGLDYVINMDAPEDTETYLHRSGRTGRMNRKGTVITLVTENESFKLKQIAKALNVDIMFN